MGGGGMRRGVRLLKAAPAYPGDASPLPARKAPESCAKSWRPPRAGEPAAVGLAAILTRRAMMIKLSLHHGA